MSQGEEGEIKLGNFDNTYISLDTALPAFGNALSLPSPKVITLRRQSPDESVHLACEAAILYSAGFLKPRACLAGFDDRVYAKSVNGVALG